MIPALREASEDPALRGAPLAVYVFLLFRLEHARPHPVKVDAVAAALEMRRQTVGRALKTLSLRGYLEPGAFEGAVRCYRLCEARIVADWAPKRT